MRLSQSPSQSQVTLVHMLEDSVNHLVSVGARPQAVSMFLPAFLAGEECHEWNGPRAYNDYGKFHYTNKDGRHTYYVAHRVSLFLAQGGNLDSELVAMHKCDNPPCVNPNHLTWGTHSENAIDKINKGRHIKKYETI